MADTAVSNLNEADALTGAEQIHVVQGGASKRAIVTALPFVPAGTGAVVRTIQSRLRDKVSVKDFGAVGDGTTDDTAAIQAALDSGASVVRGVDGAFRTTGTLTINQARQRVELPPGCTVNLDTANVELNCFNVAAAGAAVVGGRVTTTLRTLKFIISLVGDNSRVERSEVFFATKSVLADVPFNRGGVAMHGIGTEVKGCEIYNQEGSGVVSYGNRARISGNRIHDNVLGVQATVPELSTTIQTATVHDNDIYDNDVNHVSGACGVLSNRYVRLILTGNRISGSGEHGTYVYSPGSVLANNFVHDNYRAGLKVRNIDRTIVTGNVCCDNGTEGPGNLSDLDLQILDGDVLGAVISNNTTYGDNTIGIRTSYGADTHLCENVVVSGNIAQSIWLAFSSDITVSGNRCAGLLSVGNAQALSPAVQSRAKVIGNTCATLDMGRCWDSEFIDNSANELNAGGSDLGALADRGNVIRGNTFSAQTLQIARSQWREFSDNRLTWAGTAITLFAQSSQPSANSYKKITGNRIANFTVRLIDDTTSGVSGSKCLIANNVFDGTTQAISMWGSGHVVVGNVNIGSGGIGFVGMTDSWLLGNSPRVTERTGTTGNQNLQTYTGTATFDPTSLADGAGETTTVTVTGAALGDLAIASFSLTTSGLTITAWVSASNTVSVRFQNESGGVLDIASGTLRAYVIKAV